MTCTRQVEGPGAVARPATLRELRDRLGRAVLVEYVEHGGLLLAVLVRDGRASVLTLGRADAATAR